MLIMQHLISVIKKLVLKLEEAYVWLALIKINNVNHMFLKRHKNRDRWCKSKRDVSYRYDG